MKHTAAYSLILVPVLLNGNAFAQKNQRLTLDHATVFISGAELSSSARLTLAKGENEFLFSNVAGDVNDQSIVVNASGGVVVESSSFKNNYLATDNVSPQLKQIKDSIEYVGNLIQGVNDKIAVLNEKITVLQSNRKIGGDHVATSVAEVQKMLDLVETKMDACLTQKAQRAKEVKKLSEYQARLNQQLEEEQKQAYQPGGQLLVKFFAKEPTTTSINITYVVPNAGWTPTYDVRAEDAHSPVKVFYKANVFQNCGVKWDNVRLSLSTGNPDEGMQTPELSPWYLAFYQPEVVDGLQVVPTVKFTPPVVEKDEEVGTTTLAYTWSGSTNKTEESNMAQEHVKVDNSGVNASYDIDLPYTIPTDGQQHLVVIKQYETPATFRYSAIPKADKDAFLEARLTNWEDMNLLPGKTNIFYEGTFMGQGEIDPHTVKDTLAISLGRDKKIVVKRERDRALRSVKMIGTNVRETFAYNITVRNTRKEPVTILVQDQLPVSNDKDIVLEDKESGGAEYDELTGSLKWMLSLAPNESKKVSFGYTVKYPKGKTLANVN